MRSLLQEQARAVGKSRWQAASAVVRCACGKAGKRRWFSRQSGSLGGCQGREGESGVEAV